MLCIPAVLTIGLCYVCRCVTGSCPFMWSRETTGPSLRERVWSPSQASSTAHWLSPESAPERAEPSGKRLLLLFFHPFSVTFTWQTKTLSWRIKACMSVISSYLSATQQPFPSHPSHSLDILVAYHYLLLTKSLYSTLGTKTHVVCLLYRLRINQLPVHCLL